MWFQLTFVASNNLESVFGFENKKSLSNDSTFRWGSVFYFEFSYSQE